MDREERRSLRLLKDTVSLMDKLKSKEEAIESLLDIAVDLASEFSQYEIGEGQDASIHYNVDRLKNGLGKGHYLIFSRACINYADQVNQRTEGSINFPTQVELGEACHRLYLASGLKSGEKMYKEMCQWMNGDYGEL